MGDFIDAIGRGVGGLVGGSVEVIGQILNSFFGFLSPVLPGTLAPLVVGGVALLAGAWFLLKR
jgi:lipopolysaccharide export LptBFGC system permease protein LptF